MKNKLEPLLPKSIDWDSLGRDAAYMHEAFRLREENHRVAAKAVFESFLACDFVNPHLEFLGNGSSRISLRNPNGEQLDKTIRSYLNHQTMAYFVEFILANAESAKQSAAAQKRHAENRVMKQEVFAWLDTNRPRFKSMDETAGAIAGKVAPVAWRTARDWVGEWKKLRSTGTA